MKGRGGGGGRGGGTRCVYYTVFAPCLILFLHYSTETPAIPILLDNGGHNIMYLYVTFEQNDHFITGYIVLVYQHADLVGPFRADW